MSHPDTEREILEFSNAELKRAIARKDPRLSVTRAVRGLLSRERLRPVEAASLILEQEVSNDNKIAAIHALGRTQQRGTQELLSQTLKSQDLPILRATLWSLAKTGDESALERMGQIDIKKHPKIAKDVVSARRLLAFRLGVDGFGFKNTDLPKTARLAGSDLREMEIKSIKGATLAKHERNIRAAAPGLDLRIGPATEINCLGKPLWIIPTNMAAQEPETFAKRPGVVMAIYSYDGCTEAPYLKAYVMSEPGRDGIDLFVTRGRGQVTHKGRAKLEGRVASFELEALETRFDPAAKLEGSFGNKGVFKIEQALVSPAFDLQAKLRSQPREAPVIELGGSVREPANAK